MTSCNSIHRGFIQMPSIFQHTLQSHHWSPINTGYHRYLKAPITLLSSSRRWITEELLFLCSFPPAGSFASAVHQKPAQCSAERMSETRSDKARQGEMVLDVCKAQVQHMGKSWPDLLEIGIISSAALGAEQAGGPGTAAEERGRMPTKAWSKLNIRRQQVPLRLLGCSFGRGEKQAIKEAEYTRVNFICSTNCHARALIALTWSARDWALLESQAVGESSKVILVGSCSHHTFHLYQGKMEGISAVLFFHKVIHCSLFRDQKGNLTRPPEILKTLTKSGASYQGKRR